MTQLISFDKYFNKQYKDVILAILELSLEEDIGDGDITSGPIVPKDRKATARLYAKQSGIIAGLPLIPMLLDMNTKKYNLKIKIKEGSLVKKGDVVAEIQSSAYVLLTIERVLLNFLQRLSGIATLTYTYVNAIKPYKAEILDTRKTTPLLRLLEKYAVHVGGGKNHRFGLFDRVLIKDNHIEIAGGVEQAIVQVRRKYPEKSIEVEVKNIEELKRALAYHPEIILLDNMTPAMMKQAVTITKHKALLEASGGVNLKSVKKIAATGVDRISIGALTHSAPALDLSLKIVPDKK